MTRIAAIVLLCSACGAEQSDIVWVTNHSVNEYDLAALEYAVLRVVPVGAQLPVVVRMYDYGDEDWTILAGGQYHDTGEIDIVLWAGGCLADTALAHELIHYRLDHHYGMMDYGHDAIDWWLIPYITAEIAAEDPRCSAQ